MAEAKSEEWRGKIGKMTEEEMAGFLSGNPFCRIGCLDDEGWPYVVPCWFEYSDGG
jgi:nitroimidazol reductase NimA-like FMN-containing flavoprotein (pyridoxamine 5'-phosphate oxidase superfamily)